MLPIDAGGAHPSCCCSCRRLTTYWHFAPPFACRAKFSRLSTWLHCGTCPASLSARTTTTVGEGVGGERPVGAAHKHIARTSGPPPTHSSLLRHPTTPFLALACPRPPIPRACVPPQAYCSHIRASILRACVTPPPHSSPSRAPTSILLAHPGLHSSRVCHPTTPFLALACPHKHIARTSGPPPNHSLPMRHPTPPPPHPPTPPPTHFSHVCVPTNL